MQAGPALIIDTPAAETWVWSDLHLRDAGAFESSGRPFADLGAMEAAILEAWHTRVGPTDTIVCLGDVAHPSAFDDEAWSTGSATARGTGSSSLGNHDLVLRGELEAAGFGEQSAAALTHMPLVRLPYGCVQLYGHLHARGKAAPRRLDVGVDAIGFAPRRLDWLLEDLA